MSSPPWPLGPAISADAPAHAEAAGEDRPCLPLPLSQLLQETLATAWIVLAIQRDEGLVLRSPAFIDADDGDDPLRAQLAPLCAGVIREASPIRTEGGGEPSAEGRDRGSISFIGCPLHDALGRTIGVLGAAAPAPREWSDRDLEVIESVAKWLRAPLQLEAAEELSRQAEVALARSEELYRKLVESASDIIYQADREGRFTYANEAAVRVTGFSREELHGMHFTELVPDGFQLRMVEIYNRQMSEGLPNTYFEFPVVRRDGSSLWVGQNVQLLWEDGEVVGVQAVARDITERRRAEEESRRLAGLSRANPNPVVECDSQGRAVYLNPAAERFMAELGLDGLAGMLPQNHLQLVTAGLGSGQSYQHVEVSVADRTFSWTYRPHAEAGVVQLFAVDITSRRLVEEQLRHDALHDALTGLPNRLLFMERLAHAILRSRRRQDFLFAVLFLDLDRFKVVNDSLGHHVGDELLVVIAQRLHGCLRPADTVARFGGDEFAILLEDIGGVGDATRVADRLHAELTEPVTLGGFEVFTSASIGIALNSTVYDRPELLLRNADMAMYRAKAAGQARVEVFDRAMHAEALRRLQLETDLRRALERQEFRLSYQPVVSLSEEKIVAMEALVRWTHPERGVMEPDEFIPLAEETGLILPLGRWILREACRQVNDWRQRFPDRASLGIGVNLSAKQFSQADLIDHVREILLETGLEPSALKLEITESAVMDKAESAAVLLTQLKELGVKIYLDDFGTGYSSLSYLHRFPLDALKVDRSFIGRMDTDTRSRQLVYTILTLARSLDVAAVAEGIETEMQLDWLRQVGCRMGQGFLFSEPLTARAVEEMFSA